MGYEQMLWITCISTLAGFLGMEPLSWAIHKYVMHGPFWFIHKSHHQHTGKGIFEMNDLFSLLFGGVSIFLIVWGMMAGKPVATGLGLGIALYGFVYFIFHDIIVHRRIRQVGKVSLPRFLNRLAKAHHLHHKNSKTPESHYFGLLFTKDKPDFTP